MLRRLGLTKDGSAVQIEDGIADVVPVTNDANADAQFDSDADTEDKKLSPKSRRKRNKSNHIKEHLARMGPGGGGDSAGEDTKEGSFPGGYPPPFGVDPLGMQFGAFPQMGFPVPVMPGANSGAQGTGTGTVSGAGINSFQNSPFPGNGVPMLGPNGSIMFLSPTSSQSWPSVNPEGAAANSTEASTTSTDLTKDESLDMTSSSQEMTSSQEGTCTASAEQRTDAGESLQVQNQSLEGTTVSRAHSLEGAAGSSQTEETALLSGRSLLLIRKYEKSVGIAVLNSQLCFCGQQFLTCFK